MSDRFLKQDEAADMEISRGLLKRMCVIVLFFLGFCTNVFGMSSLKKYPIDEWMGIYRGVYRVGYEHTQIFKDSFNGVRGYCVNREMVSPLDGTKIQSTYHLDQTFSTISEVHVIYEAEDPNQEKYRIVVKVRLRYAKDYLEESARCGDTYIQKKYYLKQDRRMGQAQWNLLQFGLLKYPPQKQYRLQGISIAILNGYKFFLNIIPPEVERYKINFSGMQQIQVGDKLYKATHVNIVGNKSHSMFWVLPDGTILKKDFLDSPLVYIRENRKDALQESDQIVPPVNVYSQKYIPDFRKISNMKVTFSGNFHPLCVICDNRQAGRLSLDRKTLEYFMNVHPYDAAKSLERPIRGKDLARYLMDIGGIESASAEIVRQSKEIVGNEKSAYQAAQKIMDWVYKYIDYTEVGSDSAIAILRNHKGNCESHARLYTALARAAGIPTRMVCGYVLDKQQFWGHAWVESYVGDWIAIDPTSDEIYADATHIKLGYYNNSKGIDPEDLFWYLKTESATILK